MTTHFITEDTGMAWEKCWAYLVTREMQIKIIIRYLLEWLKFKRLTIPSTGKHMEDQGLSFTFGGDIKWYAFLEKFISFQKKKKNKHTTFYMIQPIPLYYLWEKIAFAPAKSYTQMSRALTIASNWKQFKFPNTMNGRNKLWCSHEIEKYLMIKRNELLT